ncbi:SusC/RagA family TonB-linked outer membrane protein [Pedobacter gandavensis]|uniref:SusC/RagA family TonB-linked outer membrane protein n=1 Tax=Pedobacter gandavensis TaxID=2679963 RepID=UPI0029300777|nr:SusC/RagA family TonB-linked outer membrane protein [Pedobacter gandavensis]
MKENLVAMLRHGLKPCCRISMLFTAVFFFIFQPPAAAQEKKNLAFKNQTIEQAFRQIEQLYQVKFYYSTVKLNPKEKISFAKKSRSIQDVLTELELKVFLKFKQDGAMIAVKAKIAEIEQATGAVSVQLINGTVIDQSKKPLPGVSVRVKGDPSRSTISDTNGKYNIRAAEKEILILSYIGYVRTEVPVGKNTNLITVLKEEVSELNQVVVTGISDRKKETYTGSSTTFTGKELMKLSSGNILQGLGLLDPSFRIIDNNIAGSDPNALPNIEIRGGNSLTENYASGDLRSTFYGNPNLPLFILDGFETSLERIVDLDMNRIESLTLLKDGSAAAIYGTRSANGVVVIVTKSPAAGKLRATYALSTNMVVPDLRDYRMLDAARLLDFEQRVGLYSSSNPSTQILNQELYNDRLALVKAGTNSYWLSQPLRTAVEQRHSVTLDGGDQAFRYSVGFSAAFNPGVMKGSSRDNYQGNMLFNYNTGNFLFRNDLQVVNTKGTASPYGNFQEFVNAKPYFPIPADEGAASPFLYETFVNGNRSNYIVNPLYDASLNTQSISQYTEIVNNLSSEWKISDDFRLRGTLGINKRLSDTKDFRSAAHSAFLSQTPDMPGYALRGDLNISNSKSFGYEGSLFATFSKLIKEKHSFYLLSGFNVKESNSSIMRVSAQGFPNPKMDDLAFAKQYKENSRPDGLDNTSRLAGFLATFNYAYDSRYFVDLSFKLDGSSQFGSNEKYAPVWSAGLGWNLHRENFIKNLNVFSSLRLTSAIAETASQNFAPYQAMTKYKYNTDNIYDQDFGAIIQGLGNANLKWQTTRQKKVAMDFGLFGSLLNVNAEYYWKSTSNLLQSVTLAPSTGFASFTDNIGSLQNNGFDIRVNLRLLKGGPNKPLLSIWGNIGANENKISKISDAMKQRNKLILDDLQYRYDGDDQKLSTLPPNIFVEGASRTAIYALPSLGIDPATGNEIYQYRDGSVGTEWKASEMVVIADERPKASGGLGANFAYKGWDAVVAGGYSFGGYLYNSTLVSKVEDIDIAANNVDERVYEGMWTRPGDQAQYSGYSSINGGNRVGATSRFVQKNNYVTISAITLGYTFNNAAFMKRLKIQNFRLNLSMNDIARFSTIRIERGTQYPFAQRISFGANITL